MREKERMQKTEVRLRADVRSVASLCSAGLTLFSGRFCSVAGSLDLSAIFSAFCIFLKQRENMAGLTSTDFLMKQ